MKRFLFFATLMIVAVTAFAQKKYVFIAYSGSISLEGAVPNDMKSYYGIYDEIDLGTILNLFSDRGYVFEQMCYYSGSTRVIMSTTSSGNKENAIEHVYGDETEAVEVARYNLQGIPVNENDKGIQIIVYSNFTTKTIIVE